jgi:hypothetical protein
MGECGEERARPRRESLHPLNPRPRSDRSSPPNGRRRRGREGFVARAARGCQMVRDSAPDGGPSWAAAGARKRPRGRTRAHARARAAPQALPPNASPHRLRLPREAAASKVSLSPRIASEARRDRPRGRPSDAERAGRGDRGGAWRDEPIDVVWADNSPGPGACHRRARFGASSADERVRSDVTDATNRTRGYSRERRVTFPAVPIVPCERDREIPACFITSKC